MMKDNFVEAASKLAGYIEYMKNENFSCDEFVARYNDLKELQEEYQKFSCYLDQAMNDLHDKLNILY